MSSSLNGDVHGDLKFAVSLNEKDSDGNQGSLHSVHSPMNSLCNINIRIIFM